MWYTDGETSAGGNDDREPDCGRLRHEHQRVAGEPGVKPRPRVEVAPIDARIGEQIPQREVEEIHAQEDVVDDGQRAEQEPGHREHVGVTAKHGERHRVADEPDEAKSSSEQSVDQKVRQPLAIVIAHGGVLAGGSGSGRK